MKPTREQLNAALPSILAAPKDSATIEQLCYRPDFGARTFVDKVNVTPEAGVENCRWSHTPWLTKEDGAGDPQIQVSILQKRVLDLIYEKGGDAPHPGDTLIADMDLTHDNLPVGTLLQAGSAVLQVSKHWNDACVKWKVRYGADALDWVRDEQNVPLRLRGVLCSVYKAGFIENGAKLSKL